jgi:hypothetical protein
LWICSRVVMARILPPPCDATAVPASCLRGAPHPLPVRVRRHAKRASTSTPPDAPHRTPRSTPPFAREACIRPAALSALPCGA